MSQVLYEGVAPSELTVGGRIAAALAEAKLSPTELARELVGADADDARVANMRRLLRKWTDDRHVPSDEHLRRLGDILDKPTSYFTRGRTTSPSPVPAEVEREALALVWETAVDVESRSKPSLRRPGRPTQIPKKFDRNYIASELAPNFTKQHILLDRVTEWEEGLSAVATATLSTDVWGLGQWYKDSKLIPGLLIVEALAQTASVALLTSPKHRGRIVLCAGYDNVRLRKPIESGEEMTFHAKARHLSGPIAHFDAWATRSSNGERIANGLFTIAVH
jgi:3-hydroxyacyl-[acyl-carrier-protein] dehydratase